MAENILAVENLSKNYGSFRAVDNISFVVPKGKVIGFLGPNGAGKTTTIQILLGITSASNGSITYFGKDFLKYRKDCLSRINFTSAFNTLLGRISVKENLLVYADLYGLKNARKKIQELVIWFEIADLLSVLYQNLSAGQKTRVNLVKSLLNDPELILMDEPTASLDPDIADKTLTYIEILRKEKHVAILYTSHNMNEITRICDEVIFLDHGKIVAQDTPINLTKRISESQIQLVFSNKKTILKKYLQKSEHSYEFIEPSTVRILTRDTEIPKELFNISKLGLAITDITIQKPTLEDVFLQIARKEKK